MNSRTLSSAPLGVDNSGRPKQRFVAYHKHVTHQAGTSYARLSASTSTGRPVAQAGLLFRYQSFFTTIRRVTVAILMGLPRARLSESSSFPTDLSAPSALL